MRFLKNIPINTDIVTIYFQSYYKENYSLDISAYSVNKGKCFNWALLAYRMYGGKLCSVFNHGGHAFIKIKRRYFDSETKEGVIDWKSLKCFGNQDMSRVSKKDMKIMQEKKFILHWQKNGKDTFIDIYRGKIL